MTSSTFDLQPMSTGDILDRTLRLYRRHFLHTLAIVSLPYLMILPVGAVLGSELGGRSLLLMWRNPVFIAGGVLFVLAYIYFYFLSTGALARSVSERYLGGTPTIRTAYAPVLRRSFSLIWVYFLVSLAGAAILALGGGIFVGAILAVRQFPTTTGYVLAAVLSIAGIVAIVYALRVFFRAFLITQVIVIEDVRGLAAIKRSGKLMGPSGGKAVLIILFGAVVAAIISFVFNFPAGLLMAMGPGRIAFVLSKVLDGIGQILSAPLVMIPFTLLYYDSRIRQEAFDLEMMARNLGVSASPSSSPETAAPASPAPPPPAAPKAPQARPTGPPRFGAFKVCPKCGTQVPNIQPSCGKCGTRVPYRSPNQ
jgi:hypothetical protein